MTQLLTKKSGRSKEIMATIIMSFILGGFGMNRIDSFIGDHSFSFQSPIIIQSPMIVQARALVSPVVVYKDATPSAMPSPTVEITPAPKGYSLR